jgi:hypothetical protein
VLFSAASPNQVIKINASHGSMEPEHGLRPWGQVSVRNADRSHPPWRLVVHESSMLLNAARREGWYAAASTHPPAVRLVTAELLRLRPPAVRLATAEPPRLRSARARREGGFPSPGGRLVTAEPLRLL